MKKLHIAISTTTIDDTVNDYSKRLGCEPCLIVEGEYALWRTEAVNFSVRYDPAPRAGNLRHLGWEDAEATEFTEETDVNGITWERFSASKQADEINELWPEAHYYPG